MRKGNFVLIACVLLFAFSALSVSIIMRAYGSAVIWTDKPDYASWETVTIYGSGFNPNTYYDIPVIKPDGNIVRGDGSSTTGWDTVQADAYGNFTYYYKLNGIEGLYEVRVYGSPWSGSLTQTPLATTSFTEKAAANLDQLRNGKATAPVSPGDWVNGNLGLQNAHYIEGYSIPYRCVMTELPTDGTSITLTLGYDIKHSGKNAIDYLTAYNRIDVPPHTDVFGHPPEEINPLIGVTGVSGTTTTYTIPAPSSAGSPVPGMPTTSYNNLIANEGPNSVTMTLFGGTITGISYVSQGSLTAAKSDTQISVTFKADSSTAVLAWGGHIASRLDWGYDASGNPRSAGGISGSPYHMKLLDWTLHGIGQQDRSLKAAAVYAPGSITVIKDAIPDDSQLFGFTSTTLSPNSFNLMDDGDETTTPDEVIIFSNLAAGTYDVTETVPPPPGWSLTSIDINDPSGGSSSSGSTANIGLAAGEFVIVIFTDTKRGTIIVQKETEGGFGTFGFVGSDTTLPAGFASFSLTTSSGNNPIGQTFSNVVPGTYYVTENDPTPAWDLTLITITDSTADSSSNLGLRKATLVVASGETVTVKFTDTKRGKIIVDKVTVPSGDPQSFSFSLTGGPDSINQLFSLTDVATPHDSGLIKPGTYAAAETVPAGWDLTSAVCSDGSPVGAINLSPGEIVTVTFTNTRVLIQKASIGDFVWKDLDGDGLQDAAEPGLQGVTVELYTNTHTLVGTTTTGVGGSYSFINLDSGNYYLKFYAPSGYVFSPQDRGTDDAKDSDANPSTGQTVVTTLTSGETDNTWDAGLYTPPVGGVWVPINKFELLAPWIGLASSLTVATITTSVVYVKRKKKQQS